MDLRQLEAFAAVMSAGSVTGAGQMLGRSQPTITRLIQELEQELGFALFERSGPKVTPTQKAFLLTAEVESALQGIRHVQQRAQSIARNENSSLRIVATAALATGLIPQTLANLPEALRPQQLQVHSMLPGPAIEAVLSKTVDLGVVSLPLEHRGLELHWIAQAPCVAVLPVDSPLADEAVISMERLAAHTIASISNPFRFRRRIDKAFEAAGVKPAHIIDTNSSLIAIQMARVGLGIALADPFTALGVPLNGVVVRPIEVDIPFFFGLVTPFARPLSDAARQLVVALEAACHELMPGVIVHPANRHDALMQSIYASQ
ncbi:LysR family transcriptional regulator [Pseudomonas huaxiensis]|uniref:LysR family transcriptional regulator n=1 Tax=Pseudomonas huaxiensis TaxID=2213017 RepID=UPI000DA6522C|nr:LysR family transcriptional regulator [Pseudomonas huaxiensis]